MTKIASCLTIRYPDNVAKVFDITGMQYMYEMAQQNIVGESRLVS
jgi:hypothetical protein